MIAVIAMCLQLALVTEVPEYNDTQTAIAVESDVETDSMDSLMDEISFSEINQVLDEMLDGEKMDFQELVTELISGEFNFQDACESIKNYFAQQITFDKKDITYLLLLSVSASVFSVFTEVLKDKHIADTGFYMLYMMMCVVVMRAFREVLASASQASENLATFMKALVPAYSLSVSLSTGPSTGASFYQMTLILISLLSDVINTLILPMIQAYMIVKIINNISEEDILSRMAGLFESAVKWMLKTTLGVLVGFQVVQSMLAPAIDSFKNTSLSKVLSAIPGIGGAAGTVTEILVGSAVLLKNGIGTSAILIILIICIPPIIQIAIFTLTYKVMAATIQPVTDKRFTGCMAAASEGGALVLKASSMVAAMFMLSIAIAGLR